MQFDSNGNFIANYETAKKASELTKTNYGDLISVCRNKKKTANGFIWKYDNSKLKPKLSKLDKLLGFI